jgi:hypothetical protein
VSRKPTATQKLEIIRAAVFSVGDTITAAEALALVGSLFAPVDPGTRINRERLAELLALVDPPRKRLRRS